MCTPGEEGVKYVGVSGAEEDGGTTKGERWERGPTAAPARRREGGRDGGDGAAVPAGVID